MAISAPIAISAAISPYSIAVTPWLSAIRQRKDVEVGIINSPGEELRGGNWPANITDPLKLSTRQMRQAAAPLPSLRRLTLVSTISTERLSAGGRGNGLG